MIRFVDLETGNTFAGKPPYKFWFSGEQSINILYSNPICFITDSNDIEISIKNNEIFKLIDPEKLIDGKDIDVKGYKYKDISTAIVKNNKYKPKITTHTHSDFAESYSYNVCIFYILGSAKQPGEYIESFYIKDNLHGTETEYKIGADFYGENESLYINLSNNGIEIPESIQKSLYDTNVHEDKRDNITLNRKWKELLSNSWDMLANKGSYKSLFNCLKWFEYGDLLKLYEVWENKSSGKSNFEIREIQSILGDKYYETLNGFSKTTYTALYCALEQVKKENGEVCYDNELNPKLEYITFKWSTEDLSLKLSLLGNFFETYFMPIHLDLIHSTIEDVVYTNTFKLFSGNTKGRSDYLYDFKNVTCNVKNGDAFLLNPVQCYVGKHTIFRSSIEDKVVIDGEDRIIPVGVQLDDPLRYDDIKNNDKLYKEYLWQLYNNIGSIVEFNINVPLNKGSYIKRSIFSYKGSNDTEWTSRTEYRLFNKNINFNILFFNEDSYDIRMQFESTDSKIYAIGLKIHIIAADNTNIKIAKICSRDQNYIHDNAETLLKLPNEINNYGFNRVNVSTDYSDLLSEYEGLYSKFKQYIPINHLSKNGNSIKLNYMYVIGVDLKNMYIKDNPNPKPDIDTFVGYIMNILNAYFVDTSKGHISEKEGQRFYEIMKAPVPNGKTGYDAWFDYLKEKVIDNYCVLFKKRSDFENKKLGYYILICKKYLDNTSQKIIDGSLLWPTQSGRPPEDIRDVFEEWGRLSFSKILNKEYLNMYRGEYVFIPEFHYLEDFGGDDLNSYTITDKDALCCIPELKYGEKIIDECEWIIKNTSTGKTISPSFVSIKEPFILSDKKKLLDPGYYDVILNYKIGKETKTVSLNSAFRKV